MPPSTVSDPRTGLSPCLALLASLALLTLLLLLAPDLSAAGKLPPGNMVDNPSFNDGAKGWSGHRSKIAVVRDRKAPDGRRVARVAQRGRGGYTIDDSLPAVSPTVAGGSYSGGAWVKGSPRTAGRRVELVLRETDAAGNYVGQSSRAVRLPKARFRQVEVDHTAAADSSSLDVYLRHSSRRRIKATFYVDAITVTADSPSPVAGDGTVPVNTSQVALISAQEDPLLVTDGSKYRYIVIRDSMEGRLEELRSAHPEAQILLYKDVGFTSDDGCQWAPLQGTGVNFCDANPHESWFLHRKTNPSQRISSDAFPSYRAMDVGDAGYQQAWADSVIARLTDAHDDGSGVRYDGVWMDDTNLFPGHGMDGQIAELTDAQYRAATVSFVQRVAPQLEAAGFATVPNLATHPWDPAQRSAAITIARSVSMINREGFVRWGESGTLFTTDGEAPIWKDEVEMAEETQAAGADLHAITYGSAGDVRGQRYARATFLIAWDGSDGGALNYRTSEADRSWQPNWTTDIGVPIEARREAGRGFMRRYSAGIVAINPASSGSQSFSLGGSYRNPDGGECVTSISLSSARGAVMPAC